VEIIEASPDPPQGSIRDAAAALAEQQAEESDAAIALALAAYLDRIRGVTRSRMRGPAARRDTRWWVDGQGAPPRGSKPIDADSVIPDRLVDEIDAALRPVMQRIARDVATETARRLGVQITPNDGGDPFTTDDAELRRAVDEAMDILAGVARRHAKVIRTELLAADAESDTLDEVLARIDTAYATGGGWLMMAGRTVGTALRHDAAVSQARALGVTHAQWLTKRDAAVRLTHRKADGQVRLLDDRFQVGAFRLRFPGDPTDLPESWPVIANCRCGLLFGRPDQARVAAARLIQKALGESSGAENSATRALLDAARRADPIPVPDGVDLPGPAYRVRTPQAVIGYRSLSSAPDAAVGQWVVLAAPVILGLLAAKTATQLVVAIPAATTLTVVGGAIVLDQTALEVIGTSPETTAARVVAID
jgi:hypothetical protein